MKKDICSHCQSTLPPNIDYCPNCNAPAASEANLFVENIQADIQLKKIYSLAKTKKRNLTIANLLNKGEVVNLQTQEEWTSLEIAEITKAFRMRSVTPLFLPEKNKRSPSKVDKDDKGYVIWIGLFLGIFLLISIFPDKKNQKLSNAELSNEAYKGEAATSHSEASINIIESNAALKKATVESSLDLKLTHKASTERSKLSELSKVNTEASNTSEPPRANNQANKSSLEVRQSKTNRLEQQPMYVDASRLNVRDKANKKGKIIWTLKQDQKVQVTNKDGNWLYIENSRFSGWVFGTYLTNSPSPKKAKTPSPKEAKISVKKVKVVKKPSVSQVKKILIDRSHAYYSGNCPCPYNTTKRGRSCGKRSAYSRPGGASPLCYNRDVTAQMVSDYIARQ